MEKLWEQKWRSFRRTEPQSKPEYSRAKPILQQENSKLLRELTDNEYDNISHIVAGIDSNDLSFNNIFKGKTRIVVPFVPGPTGELNKLINFFSKAGYNIEWHNGIVNKEVETQRGKQIRKAKVGKVLTKAISLAKKEEQALTDIYNAKQTISSKSWHDIMYMTPAVAKGEIKEPEKMKAYEILNKARDSLEKIRAKRKDEFDSAGNWRLLELTKILKFWNERGDFYRSNPDAVEGEQGKYSLVITRAPIDVLRMSDFEDITSCHSPRSKGGEGQYYKCAVEEARGNGLVTYVVENSDIPEEWDWEQDEVFSDPRRGVDGVTPVSRVRVRKYVNDQEQYEIAVPEIRTYGSRFPNLVNSVVNFFRESQPEIIKNPPKDLDELARFGGSYADNTDGTLFNRFFDSEQYSGNTYSDSGNEDDFEDEEEEAQEYRYEEEASDYDDRYNDFKYAYASYEVEGMGEEAHVYMYGGISIDFKDEELIGSLPHYREQSKISRAIQNEVDTHLGEIEFNDYNGLQVRIDAETNGLTPDPEGYRYFLEDTIQELDNEYNNIRTAVRSVLIDFGILKPDAFSKLRADAKTIEDIGAKFKHFDLELHNDGELVIDTKIDSRIPIDASLIVQLTGDKGTEPETNKNVKFSREPVKKANKKETISRFVQSVNSEGFSHRFWSALVERIESAAKQIEFPGFEKEVEDDVEIRMPFEKFSIGTGGQGIIARGAHWFGEMTFSLTLDGLEDNEDVIIALKLVEYIDEHYEQVIKLANKEFINFIKSVNNTMDNIMNITETEKLIQETLRRISTPQKNIRKLTIELSRIK